MDVETTGKTEIAEDTTFSSADEISKSVTQQGAKSAKRVEKGLLSLLSPRHIRNSESHAPRQECRAKSTSTQERPWLEALKSLEEETIEEEKEQTNAALSSVEKIPEPLIQRGAKSAKRLPPDPAGEKNSGVGSIDADPKEGRRTLITTQDQLADVVADLKKDTDLVALDLQHVGNGIEPLSVM